MQIRMTRFVPAIVAFTAAFFFGGMLQAATAQETANLPYMNTKLSPEQRATDLVHRMTLAEKASEMQNNSRRCRGSMFPHTNGGARRCMASSTRA